VAVSLEALAVCVRALDPGSRALLDLSLRRRLPFETMAGFLHTDPFDLARRRARAVARIAADLDLEGAGVVATVKAALARLPDDAWCVPVPETPPVEARQAVQAESMARAARALMEKLREHRMAAEPLEAVDPAEQPTVESEAIVLPPAAASPMAAAYSHHPAFAVEPAPLPSLADALAEAAEDERQAAATIAATKAPKPPATADQPTVETPAIRIPAPPVVRPAPPSPATRPVAEPRRRLARSGLLVGLLLAIWKLFFRGR
jgi:hypothetical protein